MAVIIIRLITFIVVFSYSYICYFSTTVISVDKLSVAHVLQKSRELLLEQPVS